VAAEYMILLTTAEAAEYIGRSPWTVYRWASEGRLTRYGGRGRNNARWDAKELECAAWDPRTGDPKPLPPPIKIQKDDPKLSG
jgi:excisionase family DNA binding protein